MGPRREVSGTPEACSRSHHVSPQNHAHTLLLGSRAQQCEDLFPVTVSLSEPVGGLKEAIKDRKQNTLNHIEAHQLEIWIPCSVTDVVEALGSVGH